MLADWLLDMAHIDYGRSFEELCLVVKKILDQDQRVYGQLTLTSSSIEGYVCEGSHVIFSCETGSAMSWSVDGQSIINYPPGSIPSVRRYQSTDIYTVLLSNDNNMLLSELIFMVSPSPPSFLVECSGTGLNFGSRNITVIANNSIPAPGNMGHSVSGLTVTLFWNHNRADVVQFFEIMLGGNLHAVAKGSQTQIQITLPECREFKVHIVAVDFCSNRNTSELFNVSCQLNTTQCPGEC